MAEKSKPYEIYKRMCNVYEEACYSKKKNMGLSQQALIKEDRPWNGNILTFW